MEEIPTNKNTEDNGSKNIYDISHVCLEVMTKGTESLNDRQREIYDKAMNNLQENLETRDADPEIFSPEVNHLQNIEKERAASLENQEMTDEEKYLDEKKRLGWKVAEENRKERNLDQRHQSK